MTQEEYNKFVARAKSAGLALDLPEVSNERAEEVREYFRQNPPIDYLSLMK